MKELIEIQTKLNAPKGQYNSFGKYNYRSCEDILAAVKPLLKEYGCLLLLSDEIKEVGQPYNYNTQDTKKGQSSSYNGTRIYVESTATIINSEGHTLTVKASAREEVAKAGMDASQITGSASSYARKYALNGLFAIDDTKDADALNVSKDYAAVSSAAIAESVAVNNSVKLEADLQAKLMPVLLEISAATTREQLSVIWNNHQDLKNNKEFVDAITKRGKEIAA